MRNFRQGFTLIEVMVVIVIMTFAVVFLFINQAAAGEKQRLLSSADEVMAILDEAKILSIRSNQYNFYTVLFDITGRTATIICGDPDNGEICNGTIGGNVFRLPNNINFDTSVSQWPTGNKIIFNRINGRASGPTINDLKTDSSVIALESAKWYIEIVVPPNGGIHLNDIVKKSIES